MEFLDDLRNQRESQNNPEDKPRKEPSSPAEAIIDAEQGQAAWDALLTNTDLEKAFEIPEEQPPKKRSARRPRAGLGLRPAQKIVLGVLTVAVLLVWGALIVVVTRSGFGGRSAPPPMNPDASDSNAVAEITPTLGTATPTVVAITPSPTSTPTATGLTRPNSL